MSLIGNQIMILQNLQWLSFNHARILVTCLSCYVY